MAHILFTPSGTLAKTNHKNRSESHLYFFSSCNHLTKENISDWFKIVLRNHILSENLMHFHIKLILSQKKNEKSVIVHAKSVDYFQHYHKCPRLSGHGKDFHFLSCHCIGPGEPKPSCPSPEPTTWLEGIKYHQTHNISHHAGKMWTVRAMGTTKS